MIRKLMWFAKGQKAESEQALTIGETAKKLSIVALTWPIFLEMLLLMLMGNVDVFMLSQYSDDSVAAVGVAGQFIQFSIVMFGFVSAGAAVIISQYIGAKKLAEAKQVIGMALVAALGLGVVVSGVFSVAHGSILGLMDLPDYLLGDASTFLRIVGGFLFIQAVLSTISAILRSYGFTRDSLIITIVMNVLNVAGNSIVIFGLFGMPVLGVQGVAAVTSMARAVCLALGMFFIFKRIGNPFKKAPGSKSSRFYIKEIFRVGLPAAGEHLSYSTYQLFLTFLITGMGTAALTARVYTKNINFFIFLFTVALSHGTQIIIGQLMGAKEYDDIYARCLKYLKMGALISTGMAILFYFLATPVLGFFTDNQEIIEIGQMVFLILIVLEPGRAFNLMINSSLRATGDVKFPVYVSVVSVWGIGALFSFVFGVVLGFGLPGILIGAALDEWVRGIVVLFRWRSRKWVEKGLS